MWNIGEYVFFDAPHQKGCWQPPSNSESNPEFSVSVFLGLFNDQSQANHLSPDVDNDFKSLHRYHVLGSV